MRRSLAAAVFIVNGLARLANAAVTRLGRVLEDAAADLPDDYFVDHDGWLDLAEAVGVTRPKYACGVQPSSEFLVAEPLAVENREALSDPYLAGLLDKWAGGCR